MRLWVVRGAETLREVYPCAAHYVSEERMPLTQLGELQARGAGAYVRQYYEELERRGQVPPGVRLPVSSGPSVRAGQTRCGLLQGLGDALAGEAVDLGDDRPESRNDMIEALLERGEDAVLVIGRGEGAQASGISVTLMEGDIGRGFTTTIVHEEARSPRLGEHYKTDPVGSWERLENSIGVPRSVIRPMPPGQKLPFME